MFELRLGLALGKTREQIRSLSFEEYQTWKLFYILEPWGWHDREYRTASILTMINNVNVSKRSHQKRELDFIRDIPKIIDDEISKTVLREKLLEANIEDRKRMIAQVFSSITKDVKIGDSGDSSS